jgi:2,4-dienoyl-CoA reductase-like NADH-dependent reductase (Old Yellow Enzyme family)
MMRIADAAFKPTPVMGLNLRNRFIRSATIEAMAEPGGAPGPVLKQLYQNLASGGVGLISTGACCPDPDWINVLKGQLVLNDQSDLSVWQDMVQAVHEHGALISLQMAPFVFLGGKLTGPSSYQEGVHMIAEDQIRRLVSIYARTAGLARRIGMDAVQVHGGHGYGLSQFLSPFFNQRNDAYGGSAENRIRIFAEIRRAIAEAAGSDFPVWIKMNAFDGVVGGLTPDIAAPFGPLLAQAGYAAIEVTGGVMSGSHNSRGPVDKNQWVEGYYLDGARKVKAATDLPVCAVGGIRTLEMVDASLSDGIADLISLSRPLIREPHLINRWASGDAAPARCISCNGCFNLMIKGQGLFCVQETKRI